MVAILAFLTFTVFIVAAWIFARREDAATSGVPAPQAASLALPTTDVAAPSILGTYLHPGHVWVRLDSDGVATVGPSDFASHFAGARSGIETPEEGARLRQGEPAWTLVSGRNRRLTQVMPIDGEILAVNRNREAVDGGDAGRARPSDWILKIRPSRLTESIRNLIGGPLADAWQEVSGMRLNAVLAPALGRVANDGGNWLENFGDLLSEGDWHALRRDLFPSPDEAVR